VSARKKKAPKRGRPALPDGASKSVFAVRLNEAERATITVASNRLGLPVSQWARNALLKQAYAELMGGPAPETGNK
jgi:hypothetical protein